MLGLLGQRLDQQRMGMAEHIDRDAGREVEIALAVGRGQPGALAPLEGEVGTRISRQKMREPRQIIRQSTRQTMSEYK